MGEIDIFSWLEDSQHRLGGIFNKVARAVGMAIAVVGTVLILIRKKR